MHSVEVDSKYPLEQASKWASGYDLRAWWTALCPTMQVLPGRTKRFFTSVHLHIQTGYEGQVRPRSSLTLAGIHAPLGTIDADYRGEISVLLYNTTSRPFTVKNGDRIAQIVFAKVEHPELVMVGDGELTNTERGTDGFGSTGR